MNVLRVLDTFFPPKTAYAHCDIPCGIYDPHAAQVAAQTVLRMTSMILDLGKDDKDSCLSVQDASQVARLTKVKEEHAEIVKHEVRVIWGDYFKPEMKQEHKNLDELVFKILKAASGAKQNVSRDYCNELIELVCEFSEIFWETKGRKTQRVKSGFPTDGEIVSPV